MLLKNGFIESFSMLYNEMLENYLKLTLIPRARNSSWFKF